MKNEHPIEQTPALELNAREEWNELLGRLQTDPNAGDARLARLREAIASGEFQVDARAIAERLLRRLLATGR